MLQLAALLAALAALASCETGPAHDRIVVCYFESWAIYRPGAGKYTVSDIDGSLCTHLIYAFAGLNSTTNAIYSIDEHNDFEENYGKGSFKRFTGLRNRYPHLKISLAIGGWNEGSTKYSQMVSRPESRAQFVHSVTSFLRKFNFDGLDLDWEYPAVRGGAPEDKENFVALVRELRQEFDKHGWILTSAIGAAKSTIDAAYDIPMLSKYLDFFHIMCYDYHGTWDKKTGPNAPLYGSGELNVDFTLRYLLKLGAPARKIVLGLPLYGRTFIAADAKEGFGVEAEEKGFQGPFTREDGYMGYNEISAELYSLNSSWTESWDSESLTPYATKDDKLISFDNPRSLSEKVSLAVKLNLVGVMVWPLDTDDFQGKYSSMKYPLLQSINKAVVENLKKKREEEEAKMKENGCCTVTVSVIMHVFVVSCVWLLSS